MYDAHVNTAIEATVEQLAEFGIRVNRSQAAVIFRNAAQVWAQMGEPPADELEEQADRHFYEREMEM